MSTLEIISAIRDILLGGAAIVTAVVAVKGLESWRRELKGKTEFETAKGMIKATYKLRDELSNCRSPLIRAYEFPDFYKGSTGKHSAEEEAEAWANVYEKRWEPVWKAIQDFDVQTLEAEALWGKDVREKTDELRQCARELNTAIEAVISNKASGGQDFQSDRNFGKEMGRKVSAVKESENPLSQKIVRSIRNIENFVRPHLKRN